MTSGSDGGSSTDVALRWKKMIQTVDFAGYVTLSSGIFLHSWKHAIVNPMLEKPGFITAAISCFVLFPIYPSCPISWSVWSINTYLVAICQFTIYFILSSQPQAYQLRYVHSNRPERCCSDHLYGGTQAYSIHCVSNNDPTLKRYSSKIYASSLTIFGGSIQNTLEQSLHVSIFMQVCLFVITLSSLKLHTENNACMLCASVSC